MKITAEDRRAASTELQEKQSSRKSMPKQVAALLARGRCKDCDLPWDAIGVGGHVPIGDGWVCGRCYRYQKTGVSVVLGGINLRQTMRGRCANRACGAGRNDRGQRERAKVLKVGGFCSDKCKLAVKEGKKQKSRSEIAR